MSNFDSTTDIRQAIYEDWYADRTRKAKEAALEKKRKEKEEQEKKEKVIWNNILFSPEVTFEWQIINPIYAELLWRNKNLFLHLYHS